VREYGGAEGGGYMHQGKGVAQQAFEESNTAYIIAY
jgi:hypothetical protein